MKTPIPSQHLSKRQREETPIAFARYLKDLVQARAALWVRADTVYRRLGLDCWDAERDAHLYPGPGPIIAHPPCGPWGKLCWSSNETRDHGIKAMELVHQYGGVVEQPSGSQLFKEYGTSAGIVLWTNQFDYGHPALKPTDLYVVSLVHGP